MSKYSNEEIGQSGQDLDSGMINILGEMLWHTTTSDPSIMQVSHEHMHEVVKYAKDYLPAFNSKSVRFLEVASYAHITGYLLAQQYGWSVTLSDISVQTLALGTRQAQLNGIDADQVRRVAIDFHNLPFPDGAFDIVYIASAMHHTLRWQMVLKELQRVTAPEGLLILQNEPCERHFCFYKFPTNRPSTYRPIETKLLQQEILNTIAEPYPGSRPETLFGMIENQKMPLSEILQILNSEGTVEKLSIDSSICISKFDNTLLAAPRNVERTSNMIRNELLARLDKVRNLLTATDTALGYCFPTPTEVTEMAQSVARRLETLPDPGSQQYEIAMANLFGGSITAVMRKFADANPVKQTGQLRYSNGERNGVIIGYPPTLTKILDLAQDLVPDIQTAEVVDISRCFPSNEWILDSNADLRYLVLTTQTGSIRLQESPGEHSHFIVLLRIYGSPTDTPFRIQLLLNHKEIAGVDVHQADSFLLRGEMTAGDDTNISVHLCHLNGAPLMTIPPVTVPAVRIVCIANIASACGKTELAYQKPSLAASQASGLKVINWGPQSAKVGTNPNTQPDGSMGIWIETSGTQGLGEAQILFAGQPAKATSIQENLITAAITIDPLEVAGDREIAIKQIGTGKLFPVGIFKVTDK